VRRERGLAWDGCLNVRDLGGHATEDGRCTRYGAVVCADSVGKLTAAGWEALCAYGVARVVDLRDDAELVDDLPPARSVEVVRVPLLQELDPRAYEQARATARATAEAARAKATIYTLALEQCGAGFVAALGAVADAPPGAVVVHCSAGRDRTGLVVALLLRLCNVPHDAVDADYAASAPSVPDDWVAEGGDPREQARRRRLASPRGAMAATLADLERRHGSVAAYLAGFGLAEDHRRRLRARLLA
jgi:protein-tyrosine phosphatase